jgi:hypothetical protein
MLGYTQTAPAYSQTGGAPGLNYSANKKYFTGGMLYAIIAIVVGACCFAGGSAGAPFALVFIGIGVCIFLWLQGASTPAQLDAALDFEIAKVKAKALAKLNLDDDQVKRIEPVVTGGYDFTFRPGMRYKKGADGYWRSNRGEAVAVFFSDELLHSYKWGFSLVEPNKDDERTDEYFYRDVVSIATVSKSVSLERIVVVKGVQQRRSIGDAPVNLFELTTSGATSITCSMSNGEITSSADKDLAERRVKGARDLIKEKKAAMR